MNKIMKALLEAKYPTLDVNILLEVVNATPNPELAVEMICGLYEQQSVGLNKVSENSTHENHLTFLSYDKWNNNVTFLYQSYKRKEGNFKNNVRKEFITLENFDSLKCSYGNDTFYHSLMTNELETKENSMSLERWNKLIDFV